MAEPCATKGERWWGFAVYVVSTAQVALFFYNLWMCGSWAAPPLAMWLLATMPIVFVLPAYLLVRRRSRRLLVSMNYRMCPCCNYSLVGAPERGACAECGEAYTADGLRRLWIGVYGGPYTRHTRTPRAS